MLHNGFFWDDYEYIVDNPIIRSFNMKEIFSSYVVSNYHPLTILTMTMEYHLFGLNVTGYHVVNLLFHLFNVLLVFYAVYLLSNKIEVAMVACLLFSINPLHVESVGWISELKDVMYSFL